MKMSVIFLLGAGGVERSQDMLGLVQTGECDGSRFLSALTLTVIPETPMARMQEKRGDL